MARAVFYPAASGLREIMLAHGMDWRGCQRLMALGVPGRFVAELNGGIAIGGARVTLGSRFWELGGPDKRLLLGCFDGGVLIDIAALSTSDPGAPAMMTGDGWGLGDEMLEEAERRALAGRHFRLRVFGDALEWLRASGEGICVFDWAGVLARLRGLGERVTLECDAGAGEQLRARLRIGGLPKVSERAPVPRVLVGEAA